MGRCRYKRLIVRLDGKRARFRARGIAHLISFVILDEVPFQDPQRRRLPINESLIHFRESARLDERIHFLQSAHGLTCHDEAAGIPIQPVADGGLDAASTLPRGKKGFIQGRSAGSVPLREKACRFIEDDDVFIFIQDPCFKVRVVTLWRFFFLFAKFFDRLIGKPDLHAVTCGDLFSSFDLLSVEDDILLAHALTKKPHGRLRQEPRQVLHHRLPCFFLLYDKFLHRQNSLLSVTVTKHQSPATSH